MYQGAGHPPFPGKGKGPPPPVGVGGVFGVVHGLPPPPVGVGWVVGAMLVSGFVENLSTLHLTTLGYASRSCL